MRFFFVLCILIQLSTFAQKAGGLRHVGGPCEDCELIFEGMPSALSWQTQIASANEPGVPLTISGTIYQRDGKTPASNVILYVYHTDHKGFYSPASGQRIARKHGHLRGWMRTGKDGRYEFRTIRPAAYPKRNNPEHIHPIIKEEGLKEYWIDEYLFLDDPLLTASEKARQEKRGGSGIISLSKNSKGEWIGKRDIILGLNIPGY